MSFSFAEWDLFAPQGHYSPAGVFTLAHLFTSAVAFLTVFILLYFTARLPERKIRLIIKIVTATIWALEAVKIGLCIKNNSSSINETVPLYFCSIALYAGILSGFCKGKARRVGDIFLVCGGVTGGTVFLALPLSSFTVYPVFHFITLQSVVTHACMLYMGLLLILSGSVTVKRRDIFYYLPLVLAVCLCALAVNLIWGSNLMFISRNYPNTPIEILYRLFPQPFFTVVTVAGQLTLPFYAGLILCRLLAPLQKTRKEPAKNAVSRQNEH